MTVAILIQDDGPYATDDRGHLVKVDGFCVVNADGSVTIRIPQSDVTVSTALVQGRHLDCMKFGQCLFAVWLGGVPLSAIAAIRPGMATLVSTFMTNHSLVAQVSPVQ